MTDTLAARFDLIQIRALVQRAIVCNVTGKVLDMRTCAVVRDSGGDPRWVYDPSVLDTLSEESRRLIAERGWTIGPNPSKDA